MSKENVRKFYALIKENGELEAKLMKAMESDSIVALAKSQGFEFTKKENDEYLAGTEELRGELDDDQLEGVAGGTVISLYQHCRYCGEKILGGRSQLYAHICICHKSELQP